MGWLRIRNWEKYQKISGNKAPYVQVQTDILLDMEFMGLPDRERLCFLLLLCLAGRTQNKLPDDANHIMHLCHFDDVPDVSLMMSRGLLEEWDKDKHMQAIEKEEERRKYERRRKRQWRESQQCPEDVPASSHPERERETEKETDQNLIGTSGKKKKKQKKKIEYTDDFEALWKIYPNREGTNPKAPAFRAYNARLKEGIDYADLAAGLERYAAWCEAKGKVGTEMVMQGSRFFGPNEEWANDWQATAKLPKDRDSLWAIRKAVGLPFEFEDVKSCHDEIHSELRKHPELRAEVEGAA